MSDGTRSIDSELVTRARGGDDTALRAVVEQAYPFVRRWTLVLMADPDDAEDLTQDVLVQMIRKIDGYEGDAEFTTWLYRVTRNAALDRFRKRKRRERLAADPGAFVALVPDAPESPAKAAENAEVRALLQTFFGELPDRQREVFDLVELQQIPAVEAAGLLGIEPVSVRAHLFKARRAIREMILTRTQEGAL